MDELTRLERHGSAPSGHEVAAAAVSDGTLPIVAAGLGFLLLRPQLAALPQGRALLAAGYLALGLAAVCASAPPRAARASGGPLPWPLALGLGLAAVTAVAVAIRPVPAGPAGTAAVLLTLAAAVAEEALFRQALYRWLAARGGAVLAVAGGALLFALVHVPFYGMAAFPVDLGAGLLFGWQRWSSGRWSVPAATHAAANLLVVIPFR
jgi:membrane protease YdiL (CAAX protease family)